MNKELSEKLFFSLWVTDFDYISARHLLAGSFFPSAASIANITMERYIKTYLWSLGKNALVAKIKNWGGNKSHNTLEIIELCKKEINISPGLNKKEEEILKNIYTCYCFRYIDVMYAKKGMCKIFKNYMYIIDKVCCFYREKIQLMPPHKGNTLIDMLLENNLKKMAALNTGNVNIREVLLHDNLFLKT